MRYTERIAVHLMDKSEVCMIRAKLKRDYVYDAIANYGYQIFTPYKGRNNLFLRFLREIWFRGNLPHKEVWFNFRKPERPYQAIILFDPLIIPEYLEWVHQQSPESRIFLSYENRADKTIRPDTVPSYVEKWSYDRDDCREYSMKWCEPSFFMEYRRTPNPDPRYDVLYVGRDKGRAEYLFQIERELRKNGLRTYFHICADRQYLRFKKRYYKRLLTYEEYLDLLVDSKAILNIVPEGQTSVTQRELEAVFDGLKCITNNQGIKQFELYDESIFYIIDKDNRSIKDFLNMETKAADTEILKQYDFEKRLQQLYRE